MKVLVYGGKGWIGQMMVELLENKGHEVILGKARVDNWNQLAQEVESIKPDRIFSSIGRTHGTHEGKVYSTIDYLELPGGLQINLTDNLRGPINLASISKRYNLHLTYLGTGCIFAYDEEHLMGDTTTGFKEEDLPNFFGSGYSTVKGQTDVLMHSSIGSHTLNCRIRMPITAEKNSRNFITKITTYEKICSIPNSMTVLEEILPIMMHMMEENQVGTYNMTNPGIISHNQILDKYQEEVDSDFEYKNFTLEEQSKILLSGRSNNYLDTTKLESYQFIKCPHLKLSKIGTAVTNALKSYKK